MKNKSKILVSLCIIFLVLSFLSTNVLAAGNYTNSYVPLKLGSKGSEVIKLQNALNTKGYSAGPVDGSYGPMTRAAVIRYQKANNLTVDGMAGPETQASLYSLSYTVLREGSKGSLVSKLQQNLNAKGYSPGPVDGIYGSLTKNAVIRFQKDNGLTVDGIAGPQTQSTLYNSTVSRGTTLARSTSYNSDDLYWLSRIIHAESSGEPYSGKVAVGSVIINRVDSKLFPNTIKGVIFEYYKGIPQFSPVADGTIYNNPSQESIQAAKEALNYNRPVGNATYFFNPNKAAAKWIVENKTYVTRIGDHVFYK
ncbi:peptidoglycan-binding protein [Sporosalibacterium faouarense]|uniref:peptidoglycan-binding protein n=1 Tax=Sporosalibacterium faouarense TaxID=516123 RepID=UPI00192C2245